MITSVDMKYFAAKLSIDDIPDLLDLAKKIGWGYNRNNWIDFFKLGTVIGHRDEENNLVSCAVMIVYENELGWLTSFIVSPGHQRKGLARRLWIELQKVKDFGKYPIGLVSTDEGVPFYESLGFKHYSNVEKYVGSFSDITIDTESENEMSSVDKIDLKSIISLDSRVTQVPREDMLLSKFKNSFKCSKIVINGAISGFAMAVPEGDFLCIGPVVANSLEDAKSLILDVSRESKWPVRIDLTSNGSKLGEWLIHNGFKPERAPPVMSYKGNDLPKFQNEYLAIAAQALG